MPMPWMVEGLRYGTLSSLPDNVREPLSLPYISRKKTAAGSGETLPSQMGPSPRVGASNESRTVSNSQVLHIVWDSDRDPLTFGLGPSIFEFSRALVAGLDSRPPPGLSPRARSRGRAPPPIRATLNCARFAASYGDGDKRGSSFASLLEILFHRAIEVPQYFFFIRCWRLLLLLLLLLGFGLSPTSSIFRARGRYRFSSTTCLHVSPSPSSTPPSLPASVPVCQLALGYEYYSVQKQQQLQFRRKKLGILAFFPVEFDHTTAALRVEENSEVLLVLAVYPQSLGR